METGTYWILWGSTGQFYCHRGGVVKGNLLRHPISKACEDHPVLENEMSENGSLQFSERRINILELYTSNAMRLPLKKFYMNPK